MLDIVREQVDSDEDWDDGSSWLTALAPLRADLFAGDLRLFYLLWLREVQDETLEDGELEPLRRLGPMTGALEAFVEFFGMDPDLVQAAAERPAGRTVPSQGEAGGVIAAMADQEKNELLARLFSGDPHAAAEIRALVRDRLALQSASPPRGARTAGEIRSRARAIRLALDQAKAEEAAADRRRRAEEDENIRRLRIDLIARRGEDAWHEVEGEIERRNAAGYDRAAALLFDLRAIAEMQGALDAFVSRIRAIRERHARKERFIQRLAALDTSSGPNTGSGKLL
jgi:hypothetical protein